MDLSSIDLLVLINGHFKHVAGTNGGEYAGPCPFCGGRDRFRIWPRPTQGNPRYWCRHCLQSGDAIDFMKGQYPNLTFTQVLSELGLSSSFAPSSVRSPPRKVLKKDLPLVSKEADWIALKEDAWQQAAEHYCLKAEALLWSEAGIRAHRYLTTKRGLTDNIIRAAGLGFNPYSHHEQWGSVEVWLYAGIVIPWKIGGEYWKVNMRRRPSELKEDDERYLQAKGGANGLYQADHITTGCTVILVEGEFDALSIACHITHPIGDQAVVAVATGSTQGAHLERWIATLAKADRILLAFDADEPGDTAAEWWQQIFGDQARRLRPTEHDVNDMVKAGQNLGAWVAGGLSEWE